MTITKCDLCKKEIKDKEEKVIAGRSWIRQHTLCLKCGKPIVDLLIKKGIEKKEEKQKGVITF